MRGLVIASVATILAILAILPVQAGTVDRESLAAILKETQASWEVPGIAVAVVTEDTTLFDAIGVRELGGKEPMTADTICGIGSVTKAMTAATLATLIQDGKASWDDPVRKHLPWFRLSDPLAD